MGEEITFEKDRISDCKGLVTLTLDQVILHTAMYHSSTSTYIANFIEIEETFLWKDGRTDGRRPTDGHLRPTLLGGLGGVDLTRNYTPPLHAANIEHSADRSK